MRLIRCDRCGQQVAVHVDYDGLPGEWLSISPIATTYELCKDCSLRLIEWLKPQIE